MSKNKFDDLLFKKLQGEDLKYNPAHWDKLSKKLPNNAKEEKKNKVLTITLAVAASIALLLASVLLVRYVQSDSLNSNDAIATFAKAGKGSGAIENNNANKLKTKNQSATIQKDNLASSLAHTKTAHSSSLNHGNAYDFIADTSVAEKNPTNGEIVKAEHMETARPNPKVLQVPQGSLVHKKEEKTTSKNQSAHQEYVFQSPLKKENHTSVAIGGGMNYGSLNAGYTLGLSAKRALGSDFFIDGTVAVIYNNNASNIGNYSGRTSGKGVASTMSSPAFTPTQNLYYMQFNPSFGYQIFEDVSVSLGGDMQQMISSDNNIEKIQFTEQGVKTFPTLDFGFTGKAEFNVTPSIKAGVLFREGLNNVVKRNNLDFVNRRYFQVQFKYDIPVQ